MCDPSGGSIYPAVWNAMLAARAHGVGASLTSVFLLKWPEVAPVIGVPEDEGWNFAGCVTFGYPTGRWGVAPRRRLVIGGYWISCELELRTGGLYLLYLEGERPLWRRVKQRVWGWIDRLMVNLLDRRG